MSRRTIEDWREKVFSHPGTGPGAKLMLVWLCDRMDGQGFVSVPRHKIAAALGVSERTIDDRMGEARRNGLLDIVSGGHKGRTAVYQRSFPSVQRAGMVRAEDQFSAQVSASDHHAILRAEHVDRRVQRADRVRTSSYQDSSHHPSSNPTRDDCDAGAISRADAPASEPATTPDACASAPETAAQSSEVSARSFTDLESVKDEVAALALIPTITADNFGFITAPDLIERGYTHAATILATLAADGWIEPHPSLAGHWQHTSDIPTAAEADRWLIAQGQRGMSTDAFCRTVRQAPYNTTHRARKG